MAELTGNNSRLTARKASKPFFLLVFLLLAGCVSTPPGGPLDDARFDIDGKLGVRWAEERFSARFRWRQEGERYDIELWGPLGQGRTILQGDLGQMQIRDGGGHLIDAGGVREVMERQLGWYLPLEAMPRWVSGQPLSGVRVRNEARSADGALIGFTQLGWRLTYDRFSEGGPLRITAERGNYRIRVVRV